MHLQNGAMSQKAAVRTLNPTLPTFSLVGKPSLEPIQDGTVGVQSTRVETGVCNGGKCAHQVHTRMCSSLCQNCNAIS
jgi:hypothetical protein